MEVVKAVIFLALAVGLFYGSTRKSHSTQDKK